MSNTKKMSLEEFLGNDSLSESLWNEDEINLDAINNSTDINILKNPIHSGARGFGHQTNSSNNMHSNSAGPPYIVKFAHLPSDFTDFEITDLFKSKFTNFIKFKLFWELNKNPTLNQLNDSNAFNTTFVTTSKVAFVELYSMRDMEKILKYWYDPLRELYSIIISHANFDDFKNYMEKNQSIQNHQHPPPDKSFKSQQPAAAHQQASHNKKANPFGAAKPVDTQSKTLEIEEHVTNLHIEDTATLRRLSQSSLEKPSLLLPGKVKILKNETKKPLSYSQIVQKSVGTDNSTISSMSSTAISFSKITITDHTLPHDIINETIKEEEKESNTSASEGNEEENGNQQEKDQSRVLKEKENENEVELEASEDSNGFVFKDTEKTPSNNKFNKQNKTYNNRGPYNKNSRGNYQGRGNSNHTSRYNSTGNKGLDSGDSKQSQNPLNDDRYSMFRPAAGFLQNDTEKSSSSFSKSNSQNNNNNTNTGTNTSTRGGYHDGRGGSRGGSFRGRGRGRGRGGRGGRGGSFRGSSQD